MKKIISLMLVLLMVFSFAACSEEPTEKGVFEDFEKASYSTLSSKVKIETKLETSLGELNSFVETVLNPDGSMTLSYTIQQFSEDFTSPDWKVTKEGTVNYKNGKYTGDVSGELEGVVASVDLNLDESKLDYSIDGNVLSATVKAENVKAILGIDVESDVSFILMKNDKKITSLTMSYIVPEGEVTVICTFN